MINSGEQIKDYVLKDQDNVDIDTASFRGKKILFSFHPLAFTSVCAKQMKALEDHMPVLERLNTVPLGMSIDHQFAKAAWAKELEVKKLRLPGRNEQLMHTGQKQQSLRIGRISRQSDINHLGQLP